MISELKKMLESVKLITLSDKTSFHFLSMVPPGEEGMEIKIMFSKGVTIGFILKDVLYILPQYFTGGRFNNIILDSEFKIARETFKLTDVISIPADEKDSALLAELMGLLMQAETTTDKTELSTMHERAKELADLLQNDYATKTASKIGTALSKSIEASQPSEGEIINTIQANNELIANSTNMDEINALYASTKALFSKIEDSNEVKKLSDYLEKIYSAKKKLAKTANKK
jgi:hypothetical protein